MIFRFERKHIAPGRYRYYFTGAGVHGAADIVPADESRRRLQSSGFDRDFAVTMLTGLGVLGGEAGQTQQRGSNVRMKAVASYDLGNGDVPICSCAQKGSNFFNGFSFFSLAFEGKTVDVYEIGFGRKGIYWCIYADEAPIAVFSMDMYTKGYGSGYTVYCEDWVKPEMLGIIGILMDVTHNPPNDGCNTYHTLNTWQKALKEKYPAAFMARFQN